MARRAAAPLAVWAVLSAACGGEGDRPADAAPAAAPAPFRSALIGDPAPDVKPFELTLKEPGREPRRAFRYRAQPGRERTRITGRSQIDVLVAGRQIQRIAPPSTEVAYEVDVAARPGGGYRCTAWITDTASADWERMAPGRGSELRTSLEKLRGHRITFELDERGHPLSHAIALPDTIESNRAEALQTLQMVDGSVVPLPAEPIGVGAVWTTSDAETGRSNLAGAVVLTYTLLAVRGDQLELSMTVGLPEEPAPLSLGEEVAGYSGATSAGAIRIQVDLRRLLPSTDGEFQIDIEGRTFGGKEELPFQIHQTGSQKVESR